MAATAFLMCVSTGQGAPPLIERMGEERMLNDCLFVSEGEHVEFSISAASPDGGSVWLAATNAPPWLHFDSTSGVFSGNAPLWTTNRTTQPGVFDIFVSASNTDASATNVITLHVVATNWTSMTMAEMVANRPLASGGEIGTPVDLSILSDAPHPTPYGGGKTLRRIVFSFTSQVAAVTGWEDDWVSRTNVVYLPMGVPAATNAGGVIEGLYSGAFGEEEFAERACAELDLPMLIINRGWTDGYGSDLMSKYNDKAVETGNPLYQFYAFSAAHFLRAADALVTIIDTRTNWPVSYTNFQAVFTGHSKFGHTCSKAAAAAPERVAGYMASGCADIDTGACRLLGETIQGAYRSKPDASTAYLGTMMRYTTETLTLMDQMNTNVQAFFTLGTDDGKAVEDYTPKYLLGVSGTQIPIPHGIGIIPNELHTTKTPSHSSFWRMWVAHCLLDRPVSAIDDIRRYPDGGLYRVEARVSGAPTVQRVQAWATGENDLDTNHWTDFESYPMWLGDGVYTGCIPGTVTSFFVQVTDTANGITGVVSSAPWPVRADYPLLHEAPEVIANAQATQDAANVYLSWTNPVSEDFVGVSILYRTDRYPQGPVDGTQIYDGAGTSCIHTPSGNGPHYYSAFTYDAVGNYGDLTPAVAGTPVPVMAIVTCADAVVMFNIQNLGIGRTNRLESVTNLLAGAWTERTNFVSTWISANLAVEEDSAAETAFYRLKTKGEKGVKKGVMSIF